MNSVLRSGDMLASVKERSELGIGVSSRAAREQGGVGLEHRFKPLARAASLIPYVGEVFEMTSDLTIVPGEQDRLGIWEVLVQGGPSDARLLSDLRHRHPQQPVLGDERRRGVHNGVTHLSAVRLDRLRPQLRHVRSIRSDGWETL